MSNVQESNAKAKSNVIWVGNGTMARYVVKISTRPAGASGLLHPRVLSKSIIEITPDGITTARS